MIKNTLSVDLESFVHRHLDIGKRIEEDNGFTVKATKQILDLLDRYNTKITFFVLGEIYKWYPQFIEEISKRGHEIGYHGHRHIIFETKDVLLEDLNLSNDFIKKYKPIGFRAPRMCLKKENLQILSKFGFKYDSSFYGLNAQRLSDHNLVEIPVSMFSYLSNNKENNYLGGMSKELFINGIPFGSGLFISLLQTKSQFFIDFANKKNISCNIFVHPWQFFDYENKNSLPYVQRFLYKRKINKAVEFLLANNRFFPMRDLL